VRQLLAYRFGADSKFEGQLVGALERAESGGAVRVVDALFVAREPGDGELAAVALQGGTGGVIGRLLGFRMGGSDRAAATSAALAGPSAELIGRLAETLEPGAAFAAVLVEHMWAQAIGDAVARLGGTQASDEMVAAGSLAELADQLV
jgi:hypothetical protein